MDSKQTVSVISADIQHGVAILTMDNPPVNALGFQVRKGLQSHIVDALENDGVRAIVITSRLALFSGGADIAEFKTGTEAPMLPDVLQTIESASKPVIAVLSGAAFGGGLEVALACHYRITFKGNKVGLPEVNLGILPGAGGTQRLPRLVGVTKALDMIVSGKPKPVESLNGLFDLIVDDPASLDSATQHFVAELLSENRGPRPCSSLPVSIPHDEKEVFETYRAGIKKQARGFFAPEMCIQAVEASTLLPLSEGLQKEASLFMSCMKTPQARAQQHFFFAERAASHVNDYAKETPIREIKKVAVIGAGTMGGGIAMNFANAGIPVILLELKDEALQKGLGKIRENYEATARKGRLSAEDVELRMSAIHGTTEYADITDADLVIEAVFEQMAIKQQVFKTLDEVCKPGAILATNTSTLDINEIAKSTNRPQDVIGMHFFSPANVMKLLEVVKADKTASDVIKTAMMLAKRINKVAVLVGVCFGFVGNRMIEPYSREANRLLLEGATPEQIDKVLYDFGFPMGPFTMGDMAGLDIGYYVRQERQEDIAHDPSYCVVADKLVEMGRVGLKSGRGAYRYEEGNRQPINDPDVLTIAKEQAEALGIRQRTISDQEIIERCLFPLINEGAKILEEGIAAKSSDIDVIYVYGYGFPVYRGGPMQYADEIGLDKIYNAMVDYQTTLGEHGKTWFVPSTLLKKLAESGATFASLTPTSK
ncbi:3-hydroxyacyl-CoA dehydrogenase NAD-binding domain-containing protein [Aestuariibacter sp. AA17]|uniref:3-hydroxyacyl-CoA dehydrogenase NAD-binding domain-containing protein n=1 Tax=Fluctibacter corallii TaxID=2984329 RepID=A0ABT3A579_9ALTE|nr:3-hydroxyacyl-CoA dehydrogenase NAD-binding domain-containing protein [Aestuariibacter sp. AA17]MCV2883790.1 3-hydroxyacyl-CoA dehydrogenase NAD-binding domain-containing protein [Aestuariibacter sp. AA17]